MRRSNRRSAKLPGPGRIRTHEHPRKDPCLHKARCEHSDHGTGEAVCNREWDQQQHGQRGGDDVRAGQPLYFGEALEDIAQNTSQVVQRKLATMRSTSTP